MPVKWIDAFRIDDPGRGAVIFGPYRKPMRPLPEIITSAITERRGNERTSSNYRIRFFIFMGMKPSWLPETYRGMTGSIRERICEISGTSPELDWNHSGTTARSIHGTHQERAAHLGCWHFPQIEGGGFLLIQPALSVMVVWGWWFYSGRKKQQPKRGTYDWIWILLGCKSYDGSKVFLSRISWIF